jgi:hypothetical protein
MFSTEIIGDAIIHLGTTSALQEIDLMNILKAYLPTDPMQVILSLRLEFVDLALQCLVLSSQCITSRFVIKFRVVHTFPVCFDAGSAKWSGRITSAAP